MDAKTSERLLASMGLHNAITACARRYFSCPGDREDAKQEAWVYILINGGHYCTAKEAESIACRAIRARYLRAWRERKRIETGTIGRTE